MGIAVADVISRLIGTGVPPIAAVVALAMAAALLLGAGTILVNQAAVSAILVMTLPAGARPRLSPAPGVPSAGVQAQTTDLEEPHMMHRLRLFLALGACAALALPAAAGARAGSPSFAATYPVASALCARVAAGHPPAALAGSSAQVSAACEALRRSFSTAQNSFKATVVPLRQQATADIAALRATCRQARAAHNPAACTAAKTQTRALLAALRVQVRAATLAYRNAVNTARHTFWASIHALRGGTRLTADNTVSTVPVLTLPSNTTVAGV